MQGLKIYATSIAPEWIDYNGHLRDAYYGLVASYACDSLMHHLGMDEIYRQTTQCTLYSLEQHLHFFHEVKQSDHLTVAARILAADHKRIHAVFGLYSERYQDPAASTEQMLLHVKQGDTPSAVSFPPEISANIAAMIALTAATDPKECTTTPGSRRMELRR